MGTRKMHRRPSMKLRHSPSTQQGWFDHYLGALKVHPSSVRPLQEQVICYVSTAGSQATLQTKPVKQSNLLASFARQSGQVYTTCDVCRCLLGLKRSSRAPP